uniref:SH3 domain-containing protein n=1 Tax=Clytia hemisphaerica TaxID=252671 RepID=A0A7M6DRR1_9CNID
MHMLCITICYARTLYSYSNEKPNELSFDRGDVLKIIDKPVSDSIHGWWLAVDESGREGFVSNTFVRELDSVETKAIEVCFNCKNNLKSPSKVNTAKSTHSYTNPDLVLLDKATELDENYQYPSCPDDVFLDEVKNRNRKSLTYAAAAKNSDNQDQQYQDLR